MTSIAPPTPETPAEPFTPTINKPMDGDEVRTRRNRLTLSQSELGKLLGVHSRAVSAWESGRRRVSHPGMLRMAFYHLGDMTAAERERLLNE